MDQNGKTFTITDFSAFRLKMLNWVNKFSIFCLLDNRQYDFSTPAFECLLGAGAVDTLECNAGTAFGQLKAFHQKHRCWLFGHLGYDLKNETENLHSAHPDRVGFADMHFFIPEIMIRLKEDSVEIFAEDADAVFAAIEVSSAEVSTVVEKPISVQKRTAREDYISIIETLRRHILRGDCYEINFCQEFFAENAMIDPAAVYLRLTELSPNPFSAFYRQNDKYCICASPERYLKKTGNRILSQPIKGTAKRDLSNVTMDMAARDHLQHSQKEKSENVMVVDMVRNDLGRICHEGSVTVDELFTVYSFPQVHQMISTVSGKLKEGLHFTDALKATFPMGSMTGAPKKSVMQLIEQYEQARRGLFSGAIGYITAEGDLDFNVVIRSLFYNSTRQYLSFQAGGGITFYSEAETEYEESLLKARAILTVLGAGVYGK